MVNNEQSTIEQEMTNLGIQSEYFNKFYQTLKEKQELPQVNIIPWKQYTTIVNYLRDKSVLGEDNTIQPDGLKIFDSKRTLETMLKSEDIRNSRRRISTGGVVPCTYDNTRSDNGSRGGIAPCRE